MWPLRNVIPRKVHKEPAQPQWRKKFGLLEKCKDCLVVHAKAYHKKEDGHFTGDSNRSQRLGIQLNFTSK